MHKMEKYLKGLIEIPQDKRNKYLERVGEKSLNKDSIFILNMLNRIEESSKFDMLLKLFEAKMDQIIDDNMYTRLCLLVDRTMYTEYPRCLIKFKRITMCKIIRSSVLIIWKLLGI